jgi:hypothetical protein
MYPVAANPDNVRSENKEQVGSNQFGNAVPVIGNNAGNQRNDHSQQWNRKGSQVSVANHSSSGKWFNDVYGYVYNFSFSGLSIDSLPKLFAGCVKQ